MSKLVKTAEEQIVSSVTAAIKSNIADGTFVETEIPDFKTEIPADRKNGDYSANGAFLLSKTLRMPPRKIAEHILEKINRSSVFLIILFPRSKRNQFSIKQSIVNNLITSLLVSHFFKNINKHSFLFVGSII